MGLKKYPTVTVWQNCGTENVLEKLFCHQVHTVKMNRGALLSYSYIDWVIVETFDKLRELPR